MHLALVGPTASGKSSLAFDLARALGDVEIVSLDSMLVYRYMDIGTAKPSAAELAEIPHHLIDVADPSEEWSAPRTQSAARQAVTEIEARGKRALLVGGTGLYFQAVIDAEMTFPGEDAAIRIALEEQTSDAPGLAEAFDRLASKDPVAAMRINPKNQRRIVRALEVIELTGRPFSSYGPGVDNFGATAFPVEAVGIWLPRPVLSKRIEDRFRAMADAGLVDEVRGLQEDPAGWSRPARQAIGYRQVAAFLSGIGAGTMGEALDDAVACTRTFARRQRMWFRRDPRINWLGSRENPALLLPALVAMWSL